MHCSTSNSSRRAFTLIELLVVIAIIAILAAILFPVFAQAREAARKTVGISNIKQIVLGTLMYTEDYDEQWPFYDWGQEVCLETANTGSAGQLSGNDPGFAAYSNQAWFNAAQPYIKNTGIFQDPDDKLKLQPGYCINFPQSLFTPGASSWQKDTWESYGWAESDGSTGDALSGGTSRGISQMVNPANDLLWADYNSTLLDCWFKFGGGNTNELYIRRPIFSDLGWQNPDPRCPGAVPWHPGLIDQWRSQGVRHYNGIVCGLADGHAKVFRPETLREVGPDCGQIVPGAGSVTPTE
jgi:prepilin-type N-terminal cleavage/methylation domain-containing protein